MMQERVTEIFSEIERMAYIKRIRDFNLFSMLKTTVKQAQIFSFFDCRAQVLIQEEMDYRILEGSLT